MKKINTEEMRRAMIEITNGKTGTLLEMTYLEEYQELRQEIREIEKKGYIVDIPFD